MGDRRPFHQVHEVFAAAPEAIPRARQFIGDWLRRWGLDDLVEPLRLAVGELVTNAIRHGRGKVDVMITLLLGSRVRIEVHDRGAGRPAIRAVQLTGPTIGGWGLRLVDQLVDSWGTHNTGGQTVVWIEMALPPTTP